jgi:hypothetical protein
MGTYFTCVNQCNYQLFISVTQKPNKKTHVPQTEESVSDIMMNLRSTLLVPGSVLAKVATSSVASTTSSWKIKISNFLPYLKLYLTVRGYSFTVLSARRLVAHLVIHLPRHLGRVTVKGDGCMSFGS